jgi:hypothetical protein
MIKADLTLNPILVIGPSNVLINTAGFQYEILPEALQPGAAFTFYIKDDVHTGDTFTINVPSDVSDNWSVKQISNFEYQISADKSESKSVTNAELVAANAEVLQNAKDYTDSKTPKIQILSTTVSSIAAGSSVQLEFTYSGVTSVLAAIPYALGGIPLSFSNNGTTKTTCKIYVRNDTSAAVTNRTIRLILFYT